MWSEGRCRWQDGLGLFRGDLAGVVGQWSAVLEALGLTPAPFFLIGGRGLRDGLEDRNTRCSSKGPVCSF